MMRLQYLLKIFLLLFLTSSGLLPQTDRTKPPEPGPAPEFRLAEFVSFRLDNGLKVFFVENHKIPRVFFKLVLDIDPPAEGKKAGYVSAAGELLRTGTVTRTKEQIDREIDFIGARLTTGSSGAFGMCLREHAPKLAEIMSDIILNASFNQEELDKIKLRMKSELEAAKDDPEEIARVVRNVLAFGKEHPYGEPTIPETIESFTLEDCKEYYRKFFRPNAAYLAVIGDLSIDEAKHLVNKYFSRWEKGDVPRFQYADPVFPDSNIIAVVDRPNSVQSVINVVYPVELHPADQEALNALVMNTILGGGVFRLFKNLRETHGYTYGAYSLLNKDKLIGSFNAYTSVRTEVTDSAVIQILTEMKRIVDEKVLQAELNEAKNYLTGNFAMQLEDPGTIADFAINIDRYDLPKDYYKNYLRNLNKISAAEVQAAAQRFIKPENANILIVGNADSIAENLQRSTGILRIRYYNIYGTEINRPGDVPPGLTAEKVIETYIDSIGGRENMLKVADRTTVLTGTLLPNNIELKMSILQKAPNLWLQKTEAGGLIQKNVFDGTNGYSITGDVKTELKGDDLERLKYESTLGLLLDLDAYGVKVKLIGTEEVNEKRTYKIEMHLPSGIKWIQYYDADSGLKIKEEKPFEVPNGLMTLEIIYSDFRDVNGIKYPFKIEQSLGRQKFAFHVDSIKVNTGLSERNFME